MGQRLEGGADEFPLEAVETEQAEDQAGGRARHAGRRTEAGSGTGPWSGRQAQDRFAHSL